MSLTLDMLSIRTVPSTYSWDRGTPGVTFTELVSSLEHCKVPSNNSKQTEYVGYAPYVSVSLSSDSGMLFTLASSINITRTVNFGDYYNSDYNEVTNSSPDYAVFTHAYVMPGLYSITIVRKQYTTMAVDDVYGQGACYQLHCVDWTWANLNSNYSTLENVSAFSWAATWPGVSGVHASGNSLSATKTKKWRREACEDKRNAGLYIHTANYAGDNQRAPLSWQWFNFLQSSPKSSINTATPWISTGFQQSDQLTWKETAGPCLLNLHYHGTEIVWLWDNITNQQTGRFTTNLTWDETRCTDPGSVTWDFASTFCRGDTKNLLLSTTVETIINEAFIRVLEIPPQAFLQVIQPEDRSSPLTVTLSPRNIISGSFPIEKIVWDLGDGSPLLTQRRWSPTLEAPFVYSGILSEDWEDPRNYDIVYTYRKTPTSSFMYYPSLTAYASSTGTLDSAAATVGPLKYADSSIKFDLLQTELTDNGKVILGQVNGNIALWKANK